MKTRVLYVAFLCVALRAFGGGQTFTVKDGYGNDVGALAVSWNTTGVANQTLVTFVSASPINNFPRPFRCIITLSPQTVRESQAGLSPGQSLTLDGTTGYVPFYIYFNDTISTVWGEYGPFTLQSLYKVTFAVPANNTDRIIRYEVWQNGVAVGSVTTSPGDAATTKTFEGLSSGDITTLNEVSSNLQQNSDGSWSVGPASYVRTVNGGQMPTPASAPVGSPGAVTAPTAITSTGVAPAPTVTKTQDVNKPVWSSTAPTGGAQPGQSTSDFTVAAYREGVEKQIDAAKTGNSSVVTAVNNGANLTAARLDTVASQVGNVNSSLGGVNAQLTTLNGTAANIAINTAGTKSSVDAVKVSVDNLKDQMSKAVKFVDDPAAYGEAWRSSQITAAKNAAAAPDLAYDGAKVTGNAVGVSGGSYSSPSNSDVQVAGVTVSFALTPPAAAESIFRACRGLLLLAACVGFVYSCSDTVNVYVAALGASGASGSALAGIENAVPGVAQAKHLASAGAVSIAIMAAASAIIAFVDVVATRYGVGLSSLLNSWDMGALGSAYGFLDQYIPLGAVTALAVLRAAFPYFVAPVYLAATTIARFAHV